MILIVLQLVALPVLPQLAIPHGTTLEEVLPTCHKAKSVKKEKKCSHKLLKFTGFAMVKGRYFSNQSSHAHDHAHSNLGFDFGWRSLISTFSVCNAAFVAYPYSVGASVPFEGWSRPVSL